MIGSLPRWRWLVPAGVAVLAALAAGVWLYRVDTGRTYRIGTRSDTLSPTASRDGRIDGLGVAVVSEAARRAGIKLQWIDSPEGPDQALRSKRVEMWPMMAVLPERLEHLHITDPWIANERCLVTARNAVQRVGYEAAVAGDGAAALEMIAGSRFHVVLMDCQMPGMDGYQTTAEIRRRERAGERIPIVAMTANPVDGDRERCSDAGMDDYLGKPLRLAELAEMLERWVTPLETCGAAAASPGPAFPTPPDRPTGR